MNDSILRRIKRCMELTKSSNEHEAAIALKQMQKLMKEHDISEDELLASEITTLSVCTGVKLRPPSWLVDLHTTVAQAFDCDGIIELFDYKNAELVFIGEKLSVQVAEYSFTVLRRKLKDKRKEYIQKHLKRTGKNANKTKMADAYCQAWVMAVYSKCRNLNPNPIVKKKVDAYMTKMDEEFDLSDFEARKVDITGKRLSRAFTQGIIDAKDVNLYTATEHAPVTLIG